MNSHHQSTVSDPEVVGRRHVLIGKFAGLSKRAAQQMIREQGGKVSEKIDLSAQVIVHGEAELPKSENLPRAVTKNESLVRAIRNDEIEVIDETELWQRLGLVAGEHNADIRNLYTPAMLAELLQVPTATVRRWHRRGLIQPRTEIRRLAYFDFQEVVNARTLVSLLAEGITPAQLERKLADLEKISPGVKRRIAQLTVIVEGKDILLREGEGLLDAEGQFRFDFDAASMNEKNHAAEQSLPALPVESGVEAVEQTAAEMTPAELLEAAAALEDENRLPEACIAYRTTLAAYGPDAEVHFRLAELLYRMDAPEAARERYYSAIELDEDFVEARANLGCVLYELGESELALAAWNGALAFHPDYADVHLHLARSLDEQNNRPDAETHWRRFLEIAPESPWAQQARQRLAEEKK
ncbi:MAG: MerR family transcriptional regulator [Planctomycetota bacterium]|nr:MerR family transcriptional regulator [Planctomycetota bacterium]